MERYPLLSVKNIPAYVVVMSLWAGFSVVLAVILREMTNGSVTWITALIFCAVAKTASRLCTSGGWRRGPGDSASMVSCFDHGDPRSFGVERKGTCGNVIDRREIT